MKTVLFVPGFQESRNSRNYARILRMFEERGLRTIFVDIDWRHTVQSQWVSQLNAVYYKYAPSDVVLAGFSFGAVTVFLAASQCPPAELVLFSLSPLFAEDIPHWTVTDHKTVGSKREAEAADSSFQTIAKSITCPVRSFIGDSEIRLWPDMKYRFEQTRTMFTKGVHVVIPGVGHAIDDEKYVAVVKVVCEGL